MAMTPARIDHIVDMATRLKHRFDALIYLSFVGSIQDKLFNANAIFL